ncbi:unnamed protein product [Pleuronectes platessa]|uniref:Uncharacterized protein n=1 Tax=Pleuronectes platessa TaxID=8262 RepID=A0A9N7TZL6_PLEPL|nr:unnamed protein product [Pleuronectes platessa]
MHRTPENLWTFSGDCGEVALNLELVPFVGPGATSQTAVDGAAEPGVNVSQGDRCLSSHVSGDEHLSLGILFQLLPLHAFPNLNPASPTVAAAMCADITVQAATHRLL